MARMKQKTELSQEEAKELLIRSAKEIQALEERMTELKEFKKNIIDGVKSHGLEVKALNQAIKRVRDKKKNPLMEEEIDLYMDVIENYIQPLK
jgi:uncharacterized protein (UPF0335 family)